MAHPWPLDEVTDNYNQGLMAPSEWWKDLQVEEVLIVAGEEEVLLDGIRDFEKKFSQYSSLFAFISSFQPNSAWR